MSKQDDSGYWRNLWLLIIATETTFSVVALWEIVKVLKDIAGKL